ncbi:MAG: hypothetical protein QM757_05340 [Paludibaculum sp.]
MAAENVDRGENLVSRLRVARRIERSARGPHREGRPLVRLMIQLICHPPALARHDRW